MPLGVQCPSCHHSFAVPDKMTGRGVKCPRCERPFTAIVPAPAPAPAVPASAVPAAPLPPPAPLLPPAAPSTLAAPPASPNGGPVAAPLPPSVTATARRPARRLTRLVMDLPGSVIRQVPGQPEGVASLALIALGVGLAAWAVTALTTLALVGLLVAALGLLLGVVSVGALVSRKQKGIGLPLAAAVVNLQAGVFAALALFAPEVTGWNMAGAEATDPVTELRKAMKNQDQNARLNAALRVGKLAQNLTVAVRELTGLLRDSQQTVRTAAAETLGQIGPPARLAYPALREAAQGDDTERVRKTAAEAMKKIGPPTINDLLPALELLKDNDPGIRSAAIQVLRLIGPDAQGSVLTLREMLKDRDPGVRVSAAQALWVLEKQKELVLDELKAGLKDTEVHVRARAALALAEMRADAKDAVPALAEALRDSNPQVRFKAAFALSAIGKTANAKVPELLSALKDSDVKVRLYAARAVWEIAKKHEVVEVFAKALGSTEADIRITAAASLETVARESRPAPPAPPAPSAALLGVIPKLVFALKDSDPGVRNRAALALGSIGPSAAEAVPDLIRSLKHSDASLRSHAAFALLRLGEPAKKAIPELRDALEDRKSAEVRLFAAQALWELDRDAKRVVPALVELMGEKDGVLRARVARVLGAVKVDSRPVIAALNEALKDAANPTLQAMAAEALGKIGAPARITYPALMDLSKVEEPSVRKAAMEAMKKIGQPGREDVPVLAKALSDSNAHYRVAAVVALAMLYRDARPATVELAKCLTDDNETVRRTAPFALATIGKEAREAIPALTEALKHADDVLVARAAYALGEIGAGAKDLTDGAVKKAVQALTDALANARPGIKVAAAQSLWQIAKETDGVVQVLSKIVEDEKQDAGLRVTAAEVLGKIGAGIPTGDSKAAERMRDHAIPALSKASGDTEDSVRAGATAALGGAGVFARDAVAALMHRLADPEPEVRITAAKALGELAQAEKGKGGSRAKVAFARLSYFKDTEPNEEVLEAVTKALRQMGRPVAADVPALLEVLKEKKAGEAADLSFRSEAARALGMVGVEAKAHIMEITALVKDGEPAIKAMVAYALSSDLAPIALPAVPTLKEAFGNKEPAVRAAVVYALGEIAQYAPPQVVAEIRPVLNRAAMDEDDTVKEVGQEALKKLPGGM